MISTEIVKGVHYVGVNDRTTTRFEGIWPLPYGVSYNSYLVCGAQKNAVIDGVEVSHCFKQIDRIKEIKQDIKIDYLIINHMEPDHSGGVVALCREFPEIKVVGNAKTADMLKGYYGLEKNVVVVADGDCIDLGGKTLQFHLTPMIHWPETMMTYLVEDKMLFAGDAFGCFGALNGGIVDTEMDTSGYYPEMTRYYSNIVAKYGLFVQKALAKFADVPVDYICSTHGPVWHDELKKVIGVYDKLSRGESEDGVVIAYASMYGNTEEMVDVVARQLAVNGIKNIKVHNVSYSDESFILRDIYTYKGLIVMSPTYNGCAFPKIEALLSSLQLRATSGKVFACAGSFTWASAAVKRINAMVEKLKFTHVDGDVEMKQGISGDVAEKCRVLADRFAAELKK
ncbi:MAG TPA: FprA family A-type flavoprotein [Candidatus Limisoma gallistercoris]|nr:FprA family A-type flavoprotein [Candidatus Limisoma gallistercoris]